MKMTFRWYGSQADPIPLKYIKQIPGITGLMGLLDRHAGVVWEREDIKALVDEVHAAGLELDVIESVNVHEDIKTGLPTRDEYIQHYIDTIRNLARYGIKVIVYNFMPVFDWLRTDLARVIPEDGSNSLYFDEKDLGEMGPLEIVRRTAEGSRGFTLPGWEPERLALLETTLKQYEGMTPDTLREHFKYFLDAVIPVCEEVGVRMACHPDDPAWPIFGLPRIAHSQEDFDKILKLHDSPANTVCLCTGSLGSNPENDVPAIIRHFGKMNRIGAMHVRNVKYLGYHHFREAAHLSSAGDLDMYAIMKAIYDTCPDTYVRPDHGRMIWDEQGRPGYGLYDRALGATYLNGLWEAIEKQQSAARCPFPCGRRAVPYCQRRFRFTVKLTYQGIREAQAWRQAGIALPGFDWPAMCMHTTDEPVWVHFGAGNIFRGFIAGLQQRLLNKGLQRSGIVAAETFDYDIIDRIYVPHDSMTLMVSLKPDGETVKEVIASIANGLKADCTNAREWKALKAIFENPSLQMASFTITEKGYGLRDMKGQLLPVVVEDLKNDPEQARHAMSVVAAMMLARFRAGARPLALVSMDNCSHNGEKLRQSVLEIAHGWRDNGLVPAAYVDWMSDEENVSFPWSMIDKITPRPSEAIEKQLEALGVEGMTPIITGRRTYIAPFVNAEVPQYLVVEDRFPNGRPPLEQAGVYMTDRDTVNRTERMKVTTCLNPLHTALAVYGCLLGYESIAAEMGDKELVELVKRIGYTEGLPVVTDPGILSPRAFIDEVVTQRLPNPFIPDTPQRIATDTSQKIPVRFGETLKSYMASPTLDAASLTAIPLALAGWLRYLLGVDDEGRDMAVSPDPMLEQLQQALTGVKLGQPQSVHGAIRPILENKVLFGVNLYEAGLAEKVERMLSEMLAGPGAVRATLKSELQ